MNALVVDASVVIKWFIPEPGCAAARRLLAQDHEFHAPDFLFAETGNVLWKKVRRGELETTESIRMISDISNLPIQTASAHSLAAEGLRIAIATSQTVYDALYAALAARLKCQFVTADQRLFRALAANPATATHVQLLA